MNDFWLFGMSVFLVLVVPGPTNTLLMTAGVTAGIRRTAHYIIAELTAYNIAVITLMFLINRVLIGASWATTLLKLVTVAYLCRMAARLWRYQYAVGNAPVRWRSVFVTTLLNPKALVFATLVFPTDPTYQPTRFLWFSFIVCVVGLGWLGCGELIRRKGSSSFLPLFPKISSCALLGFVGLMAGSFFRSP